MPTTWVRKTALPVLNAPSPVEKSTDCVASRRDMGVGGMRRRRKPGRDPEREVVITTILVGAPGRCRPVFRWPRGCPGRSSGVAVALRGVPLLAGAGAPVHGPVAAELGPRRSAVSRSRLGSGCGLRLRRRRRPRHLRGGLLRTRGFLLVARLTQRAELIHLAHRRLTGVTVLGATDGLGSGRGTSLRWDTSRWS